MNRRIALIPAAGAGERFGAGKPKQYVEIAGKTVLQHTLEIFLTHGGITHTAVVLSPEDALFGRTMPAGFQTAYGAKFSVLRCGGASRAETVRNGLHHLIAQGTANADDWILVHDAARCCLPLSALNRLLDSAEQSPEGAILALPVADTLKRGADGLASQTVSREHLWQAQTPQMFRAALLDEALSAAFPLRRNPAEASFSDGITDEASAVERLGKRPRLITGDLRNLKLTLPQDEMLVRLLLEHPQNG